MKPVDQTTFGVPGGNCFTACVASILELPIEDVPFFMGAAPWWPPFVAWCESRGFVVEYIDDCKGAPAGYSILSGQSPRHPPGCYHAVVALDGEVVHDPHPSRDGIRSFLDYITIRRRS